MPENEDKKQHHPHDKGYRQLLASKKTFLQLIKTFVQEDWAGEIDESNLVRLEKSYILQDFSEKEADIVYLLQTKDTSAIFYVLLELQSTVDYLMPFRLLLYMVEIWRDVYNNTPKEERERKDFRLPPVIPAVLYNGAPAWTAAPNFKETLSSYKKFEQHVLNFCYILFDINRYREEDLCRAANLISSIFVLDQKNNYPELVKRLHRLIGVFKKLSPEEFQQLIIWLKNVIKPKMPEKLQEEIENILDETNPMEVEKMVTNLEITLEEMQKEAETKGKLEIARIILKKDFPDETNPMEVEKMVTNLEITLEEMQKEAETKGKLEEKLEVTRAALKKGFSIDDIAEITGLDKETVLKLKQKMN